MIEKMWEILTTLTEESQRAALSKCEELGFDPSRGVVSLDESFNNLSSACGILKDAIEREKLIQLPITVQKKFVSSLEAIAKYQADLIAGTDAVENLSDAIEKLNISIWQYGLHNLSDEVLGYQTKLNQLKAMNLKAKELERELQKGISVKIELEQILSNSRSHENLLQKHAVDSGAVEKEIAGVLARTQEANQNASTHLETIQKNETSSTNLLESTTRSNAEALVLEKNINTLVSDFVTLKGELDTNKEKQKLLFDEFESYRKTINGLLGDANRTGMAASFHGRASELIVPMRLWLLVFAGSIGGLVYMGVTYLVPFLNSGNLEQLPSRLALTAPFIWLGWFSAKQYGYTSRLREDYAYKAASAMSFEGYKREAGEVDADMLKNLLDTAIKNLGDNPIRIYSTRGNHASPLHEVLEQLLKSEKLMDLGRHSLRRSRDEHLLSN